MDSRRRNYTSIFTQMDALMVPSSKHKYVQRCVANLRHGTLLGGEFDAAVPPMQPKD